MAGDRVYPPAKKNVAAATNGSVPLPAPNPATVYPLKPQYRPQQMVSGARHDRRRFSCCRCLCCGCFWAVLILCVLLLLGAVLGAAYYALFRPQRPEFSVSSLKISQFNLTTAASDGTTRLSAKLSLAISAHNPNKKISYTYDRISLTAISGGISLANGSSPGFPSNTKNTTAIHSTLASISQVLDADSASELKADLKKMKKKGLPIKILMDTRVMASQGKLKSKKIGIRVTCEGIRSQTPKGKTAAIAATSGSSCKVDLRIKIWKWTF
ncbi:unnamed protein product [Cuscuta campestris]|uniref:Late embryogenesis abundant protein LEA-2 subgroup domain-containing protein n=2 Tax=Cuscuta sect. Cleistogrammica TaxID=1824901 RepID=A0A484M795_9ASTE|nr:hypothetical protein DM860_007643 [Cuscuta australis]VFQ84720.1 unnamed protein product [Cuscuta campestris]